MLSEGSVFGTSMILFLFLLFIPGNFAACPSDSIFDASFNRCYKYVKIPTGFTDAETNCTYIGGHLVSIQNGFENGLVAGTASTYFGQTNYWIGASLISSSWTWTDGLPFNYNNWGPNQPDNSMTCAFVDSISYRWNSDACSTSRPYVCVVPQEIPTTIGPCPTTPAFIGGYCEDGWTIFRLTGSCYKKYYGKDFSQAESTCKSQNSHLASIHSEAENNFVIGLSATGIKLNATEMTWIGLQKSKLHGWEWTDGSSNMRAYIYLVSATNYTNWEPGEPADIPLVTENCVTLISDQEKLKPKAYMFWRNSHCNKEQRAFIWKTKTLSYPYNRICKYSVVKDTRESKISK